MEVVSLINQKERAGGSAERWLREEQREIAYPPVLWLAAGRVRGALSRALRGKNMKSGAGCRQRWPGCAAWRRRRWSWGAPLASWNLWTALCRRACWCFGTRSKKGLALPLRGGALLLEKRRILRSLRARGSLLAGRRGACRAWKKKDDGFYLTVLYDNGLCCTAGPLRGVRVARDERVHEGASLAVPALRRGERAGEAMRPARESLCAGVGMASMKRLRFSPWLVVLLTAHLLLGSRAALAGACVRDAARDGACCGGAACGCPAESVELSPVGGVARIRGLEGLSPGRTAAVALAGPAVNLLLAVSFGCTAYCFPKIAAFCAEMLEINLGLMLFNLLPAFPMDGGARCAR